MQRKYQNTITLELNEKPLSENTAYPRGRQGRRYLTEEAKTYKKIIGMEMTNEVIHTPLPEGYLDMRWEVHLWFGFKDNRIRDLQNYEKLVFDALSGILWADDDWKHIPKHTTAYEPISDNYLKIKALLYDN